MRNMKLTMGERFREARENVGLTAKAVSEKTGVQASVISNLENDADQDFRYRSIVTLAKFYGVTTDYLLCLTDVKSPNITTQAICKATGLNERVVSMLYMSHASPQPPDSSYYIDLSEAINYFLSEGMEGEDILNSIHLAPERNKVGNQLRDETMQEVMEALEDSKDWTEQMKILKEAEKKISRERMEQKVWKYDIVERFNSLLRKLLKMTDWTEFDNLYNEIMFGEMEATHAEKE